MSITRSYLVFASTIGLLLSVCSFAAANTVCEAPSKYSSFQALGSEQCDPRPWVFRNELSEGQCKECMYLDSKGHKTIAVGFDLGESDAKAIVEKVGADYASIVNGAATALKLPCDCDTVTCLNQSQIEGIFNKAINEAIRNAESVISSFASLCCEVQVAVVDMSYALGKPTLSAYTQFAYWLEHQNWRAAADYLRTTKWCQVDAITRCNIDAGILDYNGCQCSGQFPNLCYAKSSSCCEEHQTCCNGTITIKNYVEKKFSEMLCCEYKNAVCCGKNKCCPREYPVCCLPNYCCAPDNLCGKDGKCYSRTGKPSEAHAAELISP